MSPVLIPETRTSNAGICELTSSPNQDFGVWTNGGYGAHGGPIGKTGGKGGGRGKGGNWGGGRGNLGKRGGDGGVGTRPWWSALLACGGAYWPLAFEPSAMTRGGGWGGGHQQIRVGNVRTTSRVRGTWGPVGEKWEEMGEKWEERPIFHRPIYSIFPEVEDLPFANNEATAPTDGKTGNSPALQHSPPQRLVRTAVTAAQSHTHQPAMRGLPRYLGPFLPRAPSS